MFATIINDCKDENAIARQETRAASLFETNVVFVGVEHDLEAAGNIIDVLDAAGDSRGVVLVNIAPRNGKAHRWGNGTPFGYFWHKNTLVVSSIDGYTLSLVKKCELVKTIQLMDIPTVLHAIGERVGITKQLQDHIIHTQFRSYEFVPRVAAWLLDGIEIPHEALAIEEIADAQPSIWWIDNFGNAKTTLFKNDLSQNDQNTIDLKCGTFRLFEHLSEVPDNATACVVGSSGIGFSRFVEIVTQGESAKQVLSLKTGQLV